jgi:hypothetical protein
MRDIALGISLDGFAPFKRRKYSSWPIILFLYNLPLEIHFQLENIFIDEIPGFPKDTDSFIYPFVQEMWRAVEGIQAYCRNATISLLIRGLSGPCALAPSCSDNDSKTPFIVHTLSLWFVYCSCVSGWKFPRKILMPLKQGWLVGSRSLKGQY